MEATEVYPEMQIGKVIDLINKLRKNLSQEDKKTLGELIIAMAEHPAYCVITGNWSQLEVSGAVQRFVDWQLGVTK
jgi:flagellin-specific chaperone FliS